MTYHREKDLSTITLAVLAGGRSSRMGRAKTSLLIAGQPILVYLLNRLRWPGPTLLITAPGRERPPGVEAFDREAVDPVADEGPMRGVLTALRGADTKFIAITTVDMPGVTTALLAELIAALQGSATLLGVMPRVQGRVEPFPCILRRSAISLLAKRFAQGQRSAAALPADLPEHFHAIPPADQSAATWLNLNAPEDLIRIMPDACE